MAQNAVFQLKLPYLNIGAGNAWAGHKSDMVCWLSKLKSLLFSKLGNFGETFPMGSEANGISLQSIFWNSYLCYWKYLKTGTGNACAGHCRANESLFLTPIIVPITTDANLGGTRPTGSIAVKKKWLKIRLPEQRGWERLGGTLQSVRIAFCNFKHCSSQYRRKLGRYTANGF